MMRLLLQWYTLFHFFKKIELLLTFMQLQQSLGLEEYINRRRREREERKEVMESIKPEVDLATLQKSKPTQNITKLEKGSDDAKKHVEDKGHEECKYTFINCYYFIIINVAIQFLLKKYKQGWILLSRLNLKNQKRAFCEV